MLEEEVQKLRKLVDENNPEIKEKKLRYILREYLHITNIHIIKLDHASRKKNVVRKL